jgi:hypothetical protein
MTWNQGYTQKKQKEKTRRLRQTYSVGTTSTWSIQKEKRRKEKMLWVIGWTIIVLVAVLGVGSIVWVSINI